MKFQATMLAPQGAIGPDPIATPQDVTEAMLLRLPERRAAMDVPLLASYLALDAAAGETVTFDVWCLDEETERAGLAARKFYLYRTGVVLTAGRIALLSPTATLWAPIPMGTLYLRQTADTLTGPGTVGALGV